jgi:hypothetical protein
MASKKSSNSKLTSCPDCEKSVSKNAVKCPHCGSPLKKERKEEPKKKKLGVGAWILIIFLVIGGLSFFGAMDSEDLLPEDTEITTSATNTNLLSKSLSEFTSEMTSMTDLQRKEALKEYEGMQVEWTFYVDSVDTDVFGNYVVLGTVKAPTQYSIGSDVHVKFPDSAKAQLLQLKEGQRITISGTITDYEDWLSLTIIKSGKIISTNPTQPASDEDEVCVELESLCSLGEFGACDALLELQMDGDC